MQKTFSFLKKIKSNNNKDWFDRNKLLYLEAKEEFCNYVDQVLNGIRKFDKQLNPDLKGKDCAFRIYKDVRFSKDKTPYKTNMGASMNPGGKKSTIAGYYLHIEPGASFVAGGIYMPDPVLLQAIRQEIEYNPDPLNVIFKSTTFTKYYKGFDQEDKLKTVPKGYDKTHPQIELLKNKHFVASHFLSDKLLQSDKGLNEILSAFKALKPMLDYLRVANHG